MPTLHSLDFRLWLVRIPLNPPNRRMRTRMYGGVAGESGRPLPLCRFGTEAITTQGLRFSKKRRNQCDDLYLAVGECPAFVRFGWAQGRSDFMQVLLQDIRYSLRQFMHNPGFTLTALVSLALGIGATTAVFSVIYAALVNPYPYPNADRIVRLTIESKAGEDSWVGLNGPEIQQVRRLDGVESVLAMDFHALTMTGHDVPENVNVIGLISNGFGDLGVPPVLGRGLLPSDAIDGEDPQAVAVLSYKFWQK